ncbi:response regulator [Devosia psychrophila]|jgi:DNA-binding response OmpR family regulator|uniref:Response regulator receiver domain-containing protein n=2 Tax=Devosia psychrophila TaxID=728005 RepID=A0A1I1M7T3_9HYPH|nr:response regulator [Devosia psychrophila]SFC77730.1 Response regulator receiver domain-containing protein [Devosia psychrophila]
MTEHIEISLQIKTVDPYPVLASVAGPVQGFRRPVALLLEDEPLIAMDVEMTLEGAGFEVINLMSCEAAHGWLDQYLPDVVIVDIELRDGPCTDVVLRLVEGNIRFLVHSGDQPGKYACTPFAHGAWVSKPAAADDLARAARAALEILVAHRPPRLPERR